MDDKKRRSDEIVKEVNNRMSEHDMVEVPSRSSTPSMASLPRFICVKCGTWDQTEKYKKPCPGVDNSDEAIAWRERHGY